MRILAINLKDLDLSYFAKRGLQFEVEHTTLDVKFPLKYLYKANGVDIHTPDIHNYLNVNYPTKEYNLILYGFNPNYYGSEVNGTGGYAHPVQLNSGAFWASIRLDDYSNKYVGHEMKHLLCHIINIILKDYTPKDFMDYTPVGNPPKWMPYYMDDFPELPESNHGRTWANIVPFLPRLNALREPKIPVVTLTRNWDNGIQTLGDLSVGEFKCKTLELPWRNNQRNISCIPGGTYDVKRTFSLKFGNVYEVQKVPNRSGIYFHSGNTFFDIKGCILLGTHYADLNGDKYADLANSSITIKKFTEYLGSKPFTLIIK